MAISTIFEFDYINYIASYRNKHVPTIFVRVLEKSGVGIGRSTPHFQKSGKGYFPRPLPLDVYVANSGVARHVKWSGKAQTFPAFYCLEINISLLLGNRDVDFVLRVSLYEVILKLKCFRRGGV